MTTSTLAFGKALLLGCVVCAAMPIACGDTEETPPPKGDAESWKAKTAALKSAAEGVLKGEKGAEEALKKAANCAACHKVHKGA